MPRSPRCLTNRGYLLTSKSAGNGDGSRTPKWRLRSKDENRDDENEASGAGALRPSKDEDFLSKFKRFLTDPEIQVVYGPRSIDR